MLIPSNIVVGNWKMNTDVASGVLLAAAVAAGASALSGVQVVVCAALRVAGGGAGRGGWQRCSSGRAKHARRRQWRLHRRSSSTYAGRFVRLRDHRSLRAPPVLRRNG